MKLTKDTVIVEVGARLREAVTIYDDRVTYRAAPIEQLIRDIVESIVPERIPDDEKWIYIDGTADGHNTVIDTIHKNLEELMS